MELKSYMNQDQIHTQENPSDSVNVITFTISVVMMKMILFLV